MNFKKNILHLFIVFFSAVSFAQYSGGAGTSGDPFKISNITDLITLSTNVNNGRNYTGVYFILTTDIDAFSTRTINQAPNGSYQGFAPIGQTGNIFNGNFNGQGNSVKNIYINRPTADNIGLFGLTGSTTIIKNLELYNAEITGQNNVGGFSGIFAGDSLLNIHFDGKINGQNKIGGIAGVHTGTIVKNAYSTGYINGNSNTGGIIGELNNSSGSLQNTYNTALVNSINTVGGLVGLFTDGEIHNSYNVGAVSGNYYAGALVGNNTNEEIHKCYFNPHTSNTSLGIGTGTLSGADIDFSAKTGTDMAQKATYSGWTFNPANWIISEGETLPHFSFQNVVLHNTEFKTTSETSIDFISQVLRNTDSVVTITEYGFTYSSAIPLPTHQNATGVVTGLSISAASNTAVANRSITNLHEHKKYYGRFYAKDNNNKYYYGNTLILLTPEELKILSAKTNSSRNVISLEFDKEINASTLNTAHFNVKSDETNITINNAALNSSKQNIVELSLSQTLPQTPVVTVTYNAGTLAAKDGGKLVSFTRFTVENFPIFNGLYKPIPEVEAANKYFGGSISTFAEYMVVGIKGESSSAADRGIVYIFKRTGQKFNKIAELTSSDGTSNDAFGTSVDIYQNTIVVGAAGNNGNIGAAYVFEKSGAEWHNMTEVAKLVASDAAASDYLGASVAISGDVIIVGAKGKNSNRGAGYVYVKPKSGWLNTISETAKLIIANGALNDALGTSVDITSDYIVMGAPGNITSQGKVCIFEKPKDGWKNAYPTATLLPSNPSNNNGFGYSVKANKNIVAVGAINASLSGAVYVYSKPANGWFPVSGSATITEIKKIIPSNTANGDNVGSALALSESQMIVGARSNTISGSAFVFEKDPNNAAVWTQTHKLNSGSIVNTDRFGAAVAFTGNFLIAGAPGTTAPGPKVNNGTIYIYNSNTKPLGDTASISIKKGASHIFKASDFPFIDPDASDTLYGIELIEKPSSAKGSFTYNGVVVSPNTFYTDMTKLKFEPVANASGIPYTDFTYKVQDQFGAKSILNYKMTIKIPPLNSPPTSNSNINITINEDEDRKFLKTEFGYTDPDGDPLNSLIITAVPDKGKLYLDNNNNNTIDAGETLNINSSVSVSAIDSGFFKYEPGKDSSGSPYTTFKFKVTDKINTSSTVSTVTINVTAVNDLPVISNVETSVANYIIGKDSLLVSSTIKITDVDNANLTKATIKIISGFDADDILSFKTQAGITGTYSNGEMTLNGSATYGDYAKAIQSVSFRNNDVASPVTGTRILEFKVYDGVVWSNAVNRAINVQVVQDIPTIDVNIAAIVQEGKSVIITKNNLLSSNPNNTASDLIYRIVKQPVFGILSHTSSVTQEEINANKFIYTHNGNESVKDSIKFKVQNKSGALSPDTTFFIDITAFNDPPVFSNVPDIQAKEDSTLTFPVSNWYPFVIDPDHPDTALNFNINYSGSNIVIKGNNKGSKITEFLFSFKQEWYGTDSLMLKVSDGSSSDSVRIKVIVKEINDKPKFVDFPAFVAFQNDKFYKGNIWQLVKDIESADNLLNYQFTPENDSLTASYSKTTGNFWLDALPYFGKETKVHIKVEDPQGAFADTILIVKVTDVYTDVTENRLPEKYALYQNYPNPFNPATVIKFDLPEESEVRLAVYNILGKKVKTLLNKKLSAGVHKISWQASEYSSGVYFYRVEAVSNVSDKKFTKVEKMLLLK